MIKSITVTNYRGESLKLELARPDLSGFAVLSVTGLGPGKAEIKASESALYDGGQYNSARMPSRNIVLTLKYQWKKSVEEMRHLSYKYFPLKKKITLLFETDTRKAEIEGYVESNDPSVFSSAECTTISIICPDPHFYATDQDGLATSQFSSIKSMFEFPFSNESTTSRTIEFSSIEKLAEQNVVYNGDAEVGVTITIHASDSATGITIANLDTDETMSIDTTKLGIITGLGLRAGDDIVICTVARKKSAYLIREGKRHNILNCLDKNCAWFKLRKGDNVFGYKATSGGNNLQVKIEYRVAYEGV